MFIILYDLPKFVRHKEVVLFILYRSVLKTYLNQPLFCRYFLTEDFFITAKSEILHFLWKPQFLWRNLGNNEKKHTS
jgi:hypothetical protein